MPNSLSKFFTAPLFDHQKRSDQAKLLNRFLMISFLMVVVTAIIVFLFGLSRTGFFLIIMAVYLLANKILLQMRRYFAASWVFLIGLTLMNFVFGGMFPDFPMLTITLPFLIVSARLLLNFRGALLVLVVNLLGFIIFVQPIWGAEMVDLGAVMATLISSVMVALMVDYSARFKEKHLEESKKLSTRLEHEYQGAVEELTRAKDVLMREHESLRKLENQVGAAVVNDVVDRYNPLTGVLTEQAVKSILSNEIARTRRYQRPLSLLCVKVDDFQYLVEQGNLRGEKLLAALSDAFIEALRHEDLVGHCGTDGFYIILPETGRYASYVVGERLRHLVEVMSLASLGDDSRLTVSVGITAFQDQSKMNVERFIAQADEAVEAATSHGGNWTISWHDLSHSNL